MISRQSYICRMRSPHGKANAGLPFLDGNVRAKHRIAAIIRALMEQINIFSGREVFCFW